MAHATVRVNVYMPPNLHSWLEEAAKNHEKGKSGYLIDALLAYLAASVEKG